MAPNRQKTILVAGAASEIGRQLLPVLRKSFARTILLDQNHEKLISMARTCPDRIEPLIMSTCDVDQIAELGVIWEDEPLDFLINLKATRRHDRQGTLVAASTALCRGLAPGLQSAGGAIINVIPRGAATDSFEYQVAEAGLKRMSELLGQSLGQIGVRVNCICPEPNARPLDVARTIEVLMHDSAAHISRASIPIHAPAH
jgi:NAD(P)-dependent dehydrogenase (short-subunit alcohol dehydrogenase family)